MDKAHALVVGIAAYRYVPALPPTVTNDAQDVHDLLVDPARGGYLPGQVRLLLDGQATRAALEQALADLATGTDADSTVLVYLSSHGGRVDSGPGAGEYILAVDSRIDSAEALAATSISGAAFTEALAAISARKVLVAFDCCHAGGIGRPKDAVGPEVKAGLPERYYEALQAGRGRAILASSRSTELSWVMPGAPNSLFTVHLLAGLQGGVASDDGLVRLFDLFEYLQPRVTADQPNQHPVFKADLEENFPVALYLGGQKGAVPEVQRGYRYDAYVSYVDQEPDATWVWDTLVPRLEKAGLKVAVSGDVEQPGVARVVGVQRAIEQAKRTVAVLSHAYLADGMADFQAVLSQTRGIQEGEYQLIPVKIGPVELPLHLAALTPVDLASPRRAERNLDRLVDELARPAPARM